MFNARKKSGKPDIELMAAHFRQQFPEVVKTSTASGSTITTTADEVPAIVAPNQEGSQQAHDFRDQDPTPRASNDPWRFTPSLLDPNSAFSFSNFANLSHGYYVPTPGGINTIYHPQAGDLHTPTLGLLGLNTPQSMATTAGAFQPGAPAIMDTQGFQTLHPPQLQFPPFMHSALASESQAALPPQPPPPQQQQQQQQQQQPPPHQQSFPPSSFAPHDASYDSMDHDGPPVDVEQPDDQMASIDLALQQPSVAPIVGVDVGAGVGVGARQFVPFHHNLGGGVLPVTAERFRFHSTLNAPTAMIKNPDEIPVTYLNKGQAYSLSIVDTSALVPVAPGTRYRTFVRISFEDDQQRQKPSVCWGLWKEGRGLSEAHLRGGKLQAVEFVEAANQSGDGDDKRTRVELESSSFDGFSVVWTPGAGGVPEVNITVRFNFLSTDFSHSKGVKGIPVRLCAKTALLPAVEPTAPSPPSPSPADTAPEVCYCKVKLFRDHGAERKLSNDVAHVKKTIEKLKQQITQVESGIKDYGKRKRTSASQSRDSQRPGKVPKHNRTWSMSSASSTGGDGSSRMPIEEDLQLKLSLLNDMFMSTRSVSVLYLRGEELDDPDLYPVSLNGKSPEALNLDTTADRSAWQLRSGDSSVAGSSLVSPSPSSLSLTSQASAMAGGPWSRRASVANHVRRALEQPTKVASRAADASWIEALGVDLTYRPPPERPAKPVACFYVQRRDPSGAASYHRAVYLGQRTLADLVERVCAKWALDPARVVRCVHALGPARGDIEVEMDDDGVGEVPEGQDMILEVVEEAAPKREWEMALDLLDGEEGKQSVGGQGGGGLVLRLMF